MSFPNPVIETIDGIAVVRDDRIPGGTKRRFVAEIFQSETAEEPVARGLFGPAQHRNEFVYASPVYGYAQIALAMGATALGVRVTVFVAKRNRRHARTEEAATNGANIIEVPAGYLSNCQAKARHYAIATGATLLPFGLDCPELQNGLVGIAKTAAKAPREVWCVAGSGTLTRALQTAWPKARHFAVRVGSLTSDIGNATEIIASERFEQDAKEPPPFPSVSNYDAKAWRHIRKMATRGALFWNVAG